VIWLVVAKRVWKSRLAWTGPGIWNFVYRLGSRAGVLGDEEDETHEEDEADGFLACRLFFNLIPNS
jgi:hypothetical protein